jgi:hypothetical protein
MEPNIQKNNKLKKFALIFLSIGLLLIAWIFIDIYFFHFDWSGVFVLLVACFIISAILGLIYSIKVKNWIFLIIITVIIALFFFVPIKKDQICNHVSEADIISGKINPDTLYLDTAWQNANCHMESITSFNYTYNEISYPFNFKGY